ncbi:MAG: T9SS type A sorting domain-containing protein [Vicingaceae bacterium]
MKKLIFSLLLNVGLVVGLSSQTVLFSEDFEGATLSTTSYSANGNNAWAINSNLSVSGSKSDSAAVQQGDSLFLESGVFSTVNSSFVTLSFEHICKVDFFDKSIIQVSTDNGQSWTNLGTAEYTGSAFFSGSFSAASYTVWNIGQAGAIPDNSWWQSETFDLSGFIGNAQTIVRFALIDSDNNGALNNYGWLIDDIEIQGAPCELIPPSITLSGTTYQGQVYNTGPYNIQADLVDASGIDSASITYTVNSGSASTVLMTQASGSSYVGTIPAATVGDTICYSIYADDNTSCRNSTVFPSAGCIQFIVGSNPPPNCVGTPVFTYPYQETFASFTPGDGRTIVGTLQNNWVNATGDTHDWFVYDQSTFSGSTGPSQGHSPNDPNFMYIEASGSFNNKTAILNTPCYDLSNLSAPKFGFWYHMNGATMGDLHLDIYFGGQWVQDIIPPYVGSQGNQWNFREVNLTQYAGNIVQLRFRGNTGTSFNSDIAIDDISIIEPIANDIRLDQVITPNVVGCNGSPNDFVTLKLKNLGSATQNSIPLAYQLNNGSIVRDTSFVSLSPGDSLNHTFQQTVNLSAAGNYSFDFWVELASDQERRNDSIFNYTVSSSTVVGNFPDTTDFDNFTTGVPGTLQDGWSNSVFDQHDWYVNSGGTNSNFTGPSGDNTSGSGNYVYVEATTFNNNTAILLSKCYDTRNLNQPELSFYYHMDGIEMGDLNVDILLNGIEIQNIIPAISGNQGSNWNMQTIDLTPYKGIVKIIFRGITGNGYRSDIAIDDVILRDANPVGEEELAKASNSIQLYPNPTDGKIWLESKANEDVQVFVRNIAGQLLKQFNFDGGRKDFDLSEVQSGVYLVEILDLSTQQREVKKLVIR